MNKKIIQQYGEEILCYRMRTARQKKRMLYEDFDKQLIQLYKERRYLYEKRRNLGWELLAEPYQRGWKRTFVLREEVARSQQASFFEGILARINTTDWSHRKSFMIRRRKFGRKKYVVKEQKLKEFDKHDFARLDFNDQEKLFFHEKEYLWNKKTIVKKYVFSEPWRFVLQVRPNIIDRIKEEIMILKADWPRFINIYVVIIITVDWVNW